MREDRLWNAFCTVIWYGLGKRSLASTGHYLMSEVPNKVFNPMYAWFCNIVDKEYQDEF